MTFRNLGICDGRLNDNKNDNVGDTSVTVFVY